jgi:AcrR family transcriptional regulator
MKPTKQYILEHALKQFNQNGFVNVRLQNIADAAFVSVGHLAYHFKNKDTIIDNLYEELKQEQEALLMEFKVVPLFEDIQRQLVSLFQLQKKYLFFYLDTLEITRAYPVIQQKHMRHIEWKLQQIVFMLEFNISRGAFQKPVEGGQVKSTAWLFYACIDNWRYNQKVMGFDNPAQTDFLQSVWGLLQPWFTDMGWREYEQMHTGND